MLKLDEMLQEGVIHSVRSDGAKMLAMKMQEDAEVPVWEVLTIDKDGHISKDGLITLDADKRAVYHKTFTTEQLCKVAKDGGFIEWRPGFVREREEELQKLQIEEQLAAQSKKN